jgi:hypothetical protein
VALALLLALLAGSPHPIHTSVAELRWEARTGIVIASVRAYPDDLARALSPGEASTDAALRRYVRRRFVLQDAGGRIIALEDDGIDRAGEAVIIRLRASIPGGLAGLRVGHHLLHERFADQVNVVRVHGRPTTTLLFVPGDGLKRLP